MLTVCASVYYYARSYLYYQKCNNDCHSTAGTIEDDFPSTAIEIPIPAYTNSTYLVCIPFPFLLTDDCKLETSETFQLCLEASGLDYRVRLTTAQLQATITDDDGQWIWALACTVLISALIQGFWVMDAMCKHGYPWCKSVVMVVVYTFTKSFAFLSDVCKL